MLDFSSQLGVTVAILILSDNIAIVVVTDIFGPVYYIYQASQI